ncbi:MAG: hypothetical protein WCL21_07995 [Mariniphaga sp.]
MKSKPNEKNTAVEVAKMNRKQAIKKSGYIAAATMLILLSSNKAQAQTSPAPPAGWPA